MKYSERIYNVADSRPFRKTREAFGGLSNMSTEYLLEINGLKIPTAEALYQACRYPHLPDVQMISINQTSPMTAKMKSKAHYEQSRSDWEEVKVTIMRWCLRVKLAQHFFKLGNLLETTSGKNIVEESKKDKFWGAKRTDQNELRGVKALGWLLMELRQFYSSEARYSLLYVDPPQIENLTLLGKDIESIDMRFEFIVKLLKTWHKATTQTDKLHLQLFNLFLSNPNDHTFYLNLHDSECRDAQEIKEGQEDNKEEDFIKRD